MMLDAILQAAGLKKAALIGGLFGALISLKSTATWYFVQFILDQAASKFAVDGVQVGADVNVSATLFNGNSPLQIGGDSIASLNGWIDDARLTKGVARSIDLPSAAFPDS